MRVSVLGPLQVFDGDREVDLGGPMNRALVARLALAGGRPVGPGALIEDLWDDAVPADATNALQSIVSRTRRRLPGGALTSSPAGYVLHAEVDADAFRRLVAEGNPREALALWRGEPLADLQDAPFAGRLTPALDEARLAALETRLEQDLAAGPPDPALLAELAGLARDHPYRDALTLLHLRALVAAGRPNEALNAYESLRVRLAEELGADPSEPLRQFHARILRGDVAAPASRRALPAPLTSFVGRAGAVAELQAALRTHRLVTVLGPGGAGKTRLAIETARACLAERPRRLGDAWLVELAAVTDGDEVARAVLAGMGLLEVTVLDRHGIPPADARSRLLDAAVDADGLLVLDNCEHLVESVAEVAEQLLTRAPRLCVLATSREALQLIGEVGYQLAPLDVPADGADVEQAGRASAVRLFVERARAVDRSFPLDAGTLPAVREICRRLDGQPLAIELAAARLRTLGLEEIRIRLSDRFRLLTGGSRTLPRHRTLRAVVEWSWDLLAERERDLAERVSVFPSGVTAGGAAAVFDDATDAADLLESLADKSLLVPVRGRQPQRFRMLETLREYGVERLVERGVAEKVRSAHLDHCIALAERLTDEMTGPAQVAAVTRYDVERGNLTAAIRFAIDRGDRTRAARLLRAMIYYLSIRNEQQDAEALTAAVVGTPGTAPPDLELFLSGMTLISAVVQEDDEARQAMAERLLGLWDAHHPPDSLSLLIMAAMQFYELTGDREIPTPREPWPLALLTLLRVVLRENQGRLEGADELVEQALAGFRGCGDSWGVAATLSMAGQLAAYAGRFGDAIAALEQAVELMDRLGADGDAALCRLRLTALRIVTGDDAELVALRGELTAALDRAEAEDRRQDQVFARLGLAQLEHHLGNDAASLAHHRRVLGQLEGLDPFGSRQFEATVRGTMALAEAGAGDPEGARESLVTAARTAELSQDMPVLATVLVTGAVLAQSLDGDDERAARLLGAADVARGRPDRSNRVATDLARTLRERLGADRFRDLVAAGAALPRPEIMALALGDRT